MSAPSPWHPPRRVAPPSPPLVGREREQQTLHDLLGRLRDGHGCLVLVSGEAGIGKTALVEELARHAEMQGALVLAGACYDLTGTPPYGPWLEATRAYPADHGSLPLPPDFFDGATTLSARHSQESLFATIAQFFRDVALSHPLVLILEDLHWSDPASLELLHYLARGLNSSGLLLIATYRADELTRQHPLYRLLPRLVQAARAVRLDLQALTNEAVQALVTSRYPLVHEDATRLVTYLQARTGGNPFYLGEVLRTLETERLLVPAAVVWHVGDLDRAPVPPLVQQVIESRLATLDTGAQRLLEIGAVIGQQVPFALWQQASDSDGDRLSLAVESAREAHLIVELPDTTGISFAHALVRETCYQRQPLSQRHQLHQRIAEILAAQSDPPLSSIASHFAQAGDPRAIAWLIQAGEQALALYAADDAIAALTRAHDLAARFSQELPLAAYRARAAAYAIRGAFDRARRDHETVLERARASGDRSAEWQALLDLGMLWTERDYERTGSYCHAALALARTIGDQRLIAHSLNQTANWHANLDEPDLALLLHQEALSLFEACGDRQGVADTLDLLAMASYLNCDLAASTQYYERALSLLRDLDDRQCLAACLAAIAFNGGDLDCAVTPLIYREASFWIRSGEEGLAIAREIGWPAGEAFALFALSTATGVRGDLGRALRDAQAALATAERIGHREWTVAARYTLGRLWMEILDPQQAAAELEQALAAARVSGSRFWTATVAAALASLRISVGDLRQAAALLGTIGLSDSPRSSMGQRQCWFVQAELALACSEPDRSLAIIAQLVGTGSQPAPDYIPPQLLKLRGDALARLRQFPEAEQAYLTARESAALFGFHPLLWRIDAARGELYQAEGRTLEAAAAFQSARATIEEIAETLTDAAICMHWRERAFGRLPAEQAHGRHPATAARLSPRELDVLRLLTEGKSDREIAAALYISPRTVMRHVTGILNKLGVSSRTAAATLAVRQHIV